MSCPSGYCYDIFSISEVGTGLQKYTWAYLGLKLLVRQLGWRKILGHARFPINELANDHVHGALLWLPFLEKCQYNREFFNCQHRIF